MWWSKMAEPNEACLTHDTWVQYDRSIMHKPYSHTVYHDHPVRVYTVNIYCWLSILFFFFFFFGGGGYYGFQCIQISIFQQKMAHVHSHTHSPTYRCGYFSYNHAVLSSANSFKLMTGTELQQNEIPSYLIANEEMLVIWAITVV